MAYVVTGEDLRPHFTVDLEAWYNAVLPREAWPINDHSVYDLTHELLDLLGYYEVKAIFYTLGYVAEKYPELIGRIEHDGHLIGSPGS